MSEWWESMWGFHIALPVEEEEEVRISLTFGLFDKDGDLLLEPLAVPCIMVEDQARQQHEWYPLEELKWGPMPENITIASIGVLMPGLKEYTGRNVWKPVWFGGSPLVVTVGNNVMLDWDKIDAPALILS